MSGGTSLISVGAGSVAVGVSVGVSVGVGVGVSVGVTVGVSVGVAVEVAVGVSVGVTVGVSVGVAVSVGVDVGRVGTSAPRSVGAGVGLPLQALMSRTAITVSDRFLRLTAALRGSGTSRAVGVPRL
jgi:hypothetical protein